VLIGTLNVEPNPLSC